MTWKIQEKPLKNGLNLTGVNADTINAVWHDVLPFIISATDQSGEDPEKVREALKTQKAQLVIAYSAAGIEAVCVTELITIKHRPVCNVWIIAGRKRENWLHYLTEIETWAKAKGCVAMRHAQARMGWKRILKPQGYRAKFVVLEKDLT